MSIKLSGGAKVSVAAVSGAVVSTDALIELALDACEAEGYIRADPDDCTVTFAANGEATVKIPWPQVDFKGN